MADAGGGSATAKKPEPRDIWELMAALGELAPLVFKTDVPLDRSQVEDVRGVPVARPSPSPGAKVNWFPEPSSTSAAPHPGYAPPDFTGTSLVNDPPSPSSPFDIGALFSQFGTNIRNELDAAFAPGNVGLNLNPDISPDSIPGKMKTQFTQAEEARTKGFNEGDWAATLKGLLGQVGAVTPQPPDTSEFTTSTLEKMGLPHSAAAIAGQAGSAVLGLAPQGRFAPKVGKTISWVEDTTTGERMPQVYSNPTHAADAAAEAARRNKPLIEDARAKSPLPEETPIRKLTTPQLLALREVIGDSNPADTMAIDSLLGERVFSIAAKDKIAHAASIFDRNVATQIRRSLRGEEADLTGVERAVDDALAVDKTPLTPANRNALLQQVTDDQTAANARNPLVNGKKPPIEEPIPPEVEAVVGKRGVGRELWESMRTLASFVDLPLGRQGIRVIGNPRAFAKMAGASIEGYKKGPSAVTDWLAKTKADPRWDRNVRIGKLELQDPNATTTVGDLARSEAYPGSALEGAPVLGGAIQHSNAAYTHSLNVGRWEKMNGDIQAAEWLWKHLLRQKGPLPDSEIAAIGRIANVSTGRGQIGKAGILSKEIGTAVFSPRNTVSWIQFFTDFVGHVKAKNFVAAGLHAKTMATWFGAAIAVLKAREALGEEVEWDSNSSDFMKVIDGDQRIDIMGGGQQWIVALSRIASQKSTSLSGETSSTSVGDVLGSFILNRTHPGLSASLDAGHLAVDTINRAREGKPFTGTTKDAFGNEFGVAEVLLGATAPIIAQGVVDALRFEMETDKKYLDALIDSTVLPFLGFGGGRYRSGVKLPPMGGEAGSSAPEKPQSPDDILLSGRLQKKHNEEVAFAKQTALDALSKSPEYLAMSDADKKSTFDKVGTAASKTASKKFGLELALNGTPEESPQGLAMAMTATDRNDDKADLLHLVEQSGRLTPEAKAYIDGRRKQPDPTQENYNLSADEFVQLWQLEDSYDRVPHFIFGNRTQWEAAERAAEQYKALIKGKTAAQIKADTQIQKFYNEAAQGQLATFFSTDGDRKAKFISPERIAIEKNPLWKRRSQD